MMHTVPPSQHDTTGKVSVERLVAVLTEFDLKVSLQAMVRGGIALRCPHPSADTH